MRIYTRLGDDGRTGLSRPGPRVRKDDPRIAALGELDELSCRLGVALAALPAKAAFAPLRSALGRAQGELLELGALFAAPRAKPFPPARVAALEREIDRWERDLPRLRNFLLPGGAPAGAALHLARAAARRAERAAAGLGPRAPRGAVPYLNRLSDWLFVAARWTNRRLRRPEPLWSGR